MAGINDLVDRIASSAEFKVSKKEIKEVIEGAFKSIQAITDEDQSVVIKGFGVFKTKTTAERAGRNPQTGAQITIPEKTKLSFKAAGK